MSVAATATTSSRSASSCGWPPFPDAATIVTPARVESGLIQRRERAIDHARAHPRRVADALRRIAHVHDAERQPRIGPRDAHGHEPHAPRRAAHADRVVGHRADQARDRGAVAGEIVRIVVFVNAVLAGDHALPVDEVPAPRVVHESVAVVVHAGSAAALGPVRPDLARQSRDRSAEIGVIRQHAGVQDRDRDRAVAGRHVPGGGGVDVVTRRLVVPPRDAPQRIVRHRVDRQEPDRIRARDARRGAIARERIRELDSGRQVDDIEGGEVGVAGAGRGRRFAREFRLEPGAERCRDAVHARDAEAREPRPLARGHAHRTIRSRLGGGGRQSQLEPIADVGRPADHGMGRVHDGKSQRRRSFGGHCRATRRERRGECECDRRHALHKQLRPVSRGNDRSRR